MTYRGEDALLSLQARSLALYASPRVVEQVIVIDNDETRLSGRRLTDLLNVYDWLRSRVTVIHSGSITSTRAGSGWVNQQILKLLIANYVKTPWYVVLDAKNHAIRPLSLSDFLSPDGRARGGFQSYAVHPLKARLLTTLRYMGLDETPADYYPPTSTPFVFKTEIAREIANSHGFEAQFVKNDLTEFFLYSAWILQRDGDWSRVFDGNAIQCPVVWGGSANASGVEEAIRLAADFDAPFFGVHRRALQRLRPSDYRLLAQHWVSWGLMRSLHEAQQFRLRFFREQTASLVLRRLYRR
ncbi:DUF6492 family protein [Microbacterium sp. KR10-403]|uniref:DUF6492 family protein n=1 Tax=Microbacterium sp. KR10-403 TaxID=3158581 RepID=UPI0032E495BB